MGILDSFENIILLGSYLLMVTVFLWGFIIGLIRGRYKVVRRFIYVILVMFSLLYVVPFALRTLLDVYIPFGLEATPREFITNFIESNEGVNEILASFPSLEPIAFDLAIALISPLLYIVLVWVGIPLLLPLYWIYLLIFKLIVRRKKYVIENGEVKRNEKGKKIKVKYKKHRFSAGLIRGIQSVFVFSIILMPLNTALRLYNNAKNESNNPSVSLCSSISMLNEYEDICNYIEIYNNSFLGKTAKYNIVDEYMFKQLTSFEVNGIKTNIEDEINAIIKMAVNLEKSGVINLVMDENFDIANANLSSIEYEFIDEAINSLMASKIFSSLATEGVNYLISLATPQILEMINEDQLTINLNYSVENFTSDIDVLSTILFIIIDNNLTSLAGLDFANPLSIKEIISEDVAHQLIENILEIKIVKDLLPHIMVSYLGEYGASLPSSNVSLVNEEEMIKKVISLLYTINSLNPQEILNSISSQQINLLGSIFAQISQSPILKDVISTTMGIVFNDYLSEFNFDESIFEDVDWEEEFSFLSNSVSYLKESGLFSVLIEGNFDINTISMQEIDFSLIKDGVNELLETQTLSTLILQGANYGIDNLETQIENAINLESGTLNLVYNTSSLQNDYSILIDIIEIVFNNDLINTLQNENFDPLIDLKTSLSEENFKLIIEKLLDVSLVRKIMPYVTYQYLGDYGASLLSEQEILALNWTVEKNILKRVVDLIYEIDLNNLSDPSLIFANMSGEQIIEIGSIIDLVNDSSLLNNVVPTTITNLINDTIGEGTISIDVVRNVQMWANEIAIIKRIYTIYNEFSQNQVILYNDLRFALDEISESELMMSLIEPLASFAIPLLDQNIVIAEDLDWDLEIEYLKTIVDNLESIGQLSDLSIDVIQEEVKRNALGNILNAALSSNLFGDYIKNMVVDFTNPLLEGFGLSIQISDINNVSNWSSELSAMNNLISEYIIVNNATYSFEIPEINSQSLNTLLGHLESLKIIENHLNSLLVAAIEMSGFMNEQELLSFKQIDKSAMVYENEKAILLNIFEHASLISGLASLDLTTVDTTALGDILNHIYGKADPLLTYSILLKDYISNKILSLMPGEILVEESDLESVANWQNELSYIKLILSSSYDINNISSFDINIATQEDINNVGDILNNSLKTTLFADEVAAKMVTVLTNAEIDRTVEEIKAVSDWVEELQLIKDILNADANSDGMTIGLLFDRIEDSQLLSPEKERILLEIAAFIDENIDPSTPLSAQQYEYEKALLLSLINSKTLFENFDDPLYSFKDESDQNILVLANIIELAADSILFEEKVSTSLEQIFTDNNIEFSVQLSEINPWYNELILIKEMLNINENSDSVEIELMLLNIENSQLLASQKETILIKFARFIDDTISEETTLSEQQYLYEKELLLTLIENKTILDNISESTSLEFIPDQNLQVLGNTADQAAYSVLFSNKIETTIKDILLINNINYQGTLVEGINWYDEFILLQQTIAINDQISSNQLETILLAIDDSAVLNGDKWTILQELFDQFNISYTVDTNDTWENQVSALISAYESL